MKNLRNYGIYMLAVTAMLTASCSDNDKDVYGIVTLSESSLAAYTGHTAQVAIEGGSGDYSPAASDPAIAGVKVVENAAGEYMLVIEPLKEGSATVTVTDSKTGLSARCLVEVTKRISRITFKEILTMGIPDLGIVDDGAYPAGSTITIAYENPENGSWSVEDGNGNEIERGSVMIENSPGGDMPQSYRLLPPPSQVYGYDRWTVTTGGGERTFGVFRVEDIPPTRLNSKPQTRTHLRIYEDLTDLYREALPGAGIEGVVRVLVCG